MDKTIDTSRTIAIDGSKSGTVVRLVVAIVGLLFAGAVATLGLLLALLGRTEIAFLFCLFVVASSLGVFA